MRVIVKLYATLRQYQPDVSRNGLCLDIPAGTTIADILPRLGLPDGVPLVAMVNERVEHLDYILSEGDTLHLFPPVAGG